ncbi:hypothetical protein FOA52_005231 [Chlamydomonas sp. UWO 241]|nr:hypothetical protein FOA52_005231 [Chlamydomonas sp. UWO 241]
MDEEEATAAAAERIAAAAEDGTCLTVRLATDVVRFLYGGTGRREPADGGVVSASLLNAKPAVGGIGVEPRRGGVLRVLFTVASDAVANTVVRWRHELRRCVDSTAVFDVLSDREEAQHQALWPAFLAAKVAGKRAQFHRARLVVDGERARADARKMLSMEIDDEHSRALPGYSVGKVIGEGGFCMVRVGVHHASRRKVAIKVVDRDRLVDPNEAKRMQREIRVMKHLCHECVIKLFEVVEAEKTLYLIMELTPNGSLLDYVRARKRMREPDAAHALQQIVAGLEFCHKREVVHRDVKLENILIDSSNRMKLIDFGLSAFYIPGRKLKARGVLKSVHVCEERG